MNSFYTREELEQIGFCHLGENVLISKHASIYGADHISIGNNVRIDDFCILTGSIEIGNYVHISAYAALFAGEAGIVLKDFVGVSSRCVIYAITDDYSGNALTNPMIPDFYRNVIGAKVVMEKHSLLGTGCSVLPGVTIGEGTAVGSMSFVNRPLDAWGVYIGIPCHRLKDRSKKLLELEKQMFLK